MKKFILPILAMQFLYACGGGGGGSNEITTTNTVTANTTAATFANNGGVTSMAAVNNQNATAKVTRDSNNAITKLEFTNYLGTLTLSRAAGDTIEELVFAEGTVVSAYNASQSKQIFYVADSNMAIGSWYDASGAAGYSSVGHTGIKTTIDPSTVLAAATYNGILLGTLAENNFSPVRTVSSLRAIANFNAKSISVNSSGTRAVDLNGNNLGAYAGQDFVATISDANSDNIYTGNVVDSEGKTGTITATLYGSTAQEIGGVGTTANGANTRVHQFVFAAER